MTSSKLINFDKATLLVFSVLIASLAINLFIKCGFDFEYMQLSSSYYGSNGDISYTTSIMYILFTRVKQLIFIVLLMKMLNTEIVYNGLIVSLSFLFGMLATIQTYYSGLVGIVELLLYLLPHYVFYLVLIYLVYKHYKNWSKDNFQIAKIMFFMVLFCTGVVCEGFFSRIFLENFYQHIVMNI